MINYIWATIILLSILCSIVTNNVENLSNGFLNGATDAIELLIIMCGMMCLWSGVMNIAEKIGAIDVLSKIFNPVLKRIMPEYKYNNNVMKAVSSNITANLLGMGNAATPLGIEAMKRMNISNNTTANNSMIIFVIINTASIQLIPTMVGVLRQNAGSTNPFIILPCVWISSIFSVVIGISLAKVLEKFKS